MLLTKTYTSKRPNKLELVGDTQTDYTYDEVGNRLTQKKKDDMP